jgi:hypothetical protein
MGRVGLKPKSTKDVTEPKPLAPIIGSTHAHKEVSPVYYRARRDECNSENKIGVLHKTCTRRGTLTHRVYTLSSAHKPKQELFISALMSPAAACFLVALRTQKKKKKKYLCDLNDVQLTARQSPQGARYVVRIVRERPRAIRQ